MPHNRYVRLPPTAEPAFSSTIPRQHDYDPEFDTFAWYCTEAANNSRAPQLPYSATSGSSAVRSPPELKAPRRTSSKSRAPASAAAAHSNRTPHNLIERRYRHKLQSELDNLTSKIPGWETENSAGIDIENAEHALKSRSKASVIAAAAKHIESLERDNESKDEFVKTLQGQIEGLQKLVHCDDCAIMRCLQDSRMTCRAE